MSKEYFPAKTGAMIDEIFWIALLKGQINQFNIFSQDSIIPV